MLCDLFVTESSFTQAREQVYFSYLCSFYSCVDGNSQDPERERRPFSRSLAIPMIHQTHTTCVSTVFTGYILELLTSKF
jgi:hypothetical protein